MKYLHLLRHAKSDWDDQALPDHERPLAPRGRDAARRVAAYLRKARLRPDLVLCSSAVRAVETYQAIAGALGRSVSVSVEDALYAATWGDLLARLQELPSQLERVLVIGHNPSLEELAAELAGDGEDAALSYLGAKFPTAALATLRFEGPWSSLGAGCAYLVSLVIPADLG